MMRFVTSVRIRLRVQSSARHNELVGFREGTLIVRVTAAAIEGRANESLRRLVAKRLRVPTSAVTIVRGHRSRDKFIEIDGLDHRTLLKALLVAPRYRCDRRSAVSDVRHWRHAPRCRLASSPGWYRRLNGRSRRD